MFKDVKYVFFYIPHCQLHICNLTIARLQIFLSIQTRMKQVLGVLGCKIITWGCLHPPMLVLLPSHFVKFLYFDLPKIFFSTLQDPLRIYIMAVFCSTKINFRKIFSTFMRGLKMLVIHVALVGVVQNSLIVNYNNNEFIKMFCWLAFLLKVSLEKVKDHSRLIL